MSDLVSAPSPIRTATREPRKSGTHTTGVRQAGPQAGVAGAPWSRQHPGRLGQVAEHVQGARAGRSRPATCRSPRGAVGTGPEKISCSGKLKPAGRLTPAR